MSRRPASQTMSKASDISSATARVAPNLLKVLAILSDTIVRRSAVDREDLKAYWKSEKTRFFYVINNSIIYKFFKDFVNRKKKTKREVVFSCRPFPNILKYRDHRRNLITIWKTRLLQTLIKEFN